MADEQILALLTEIRDLQKQHLEKYKIALQNQEKALEVQRNSVSRARTLLIIVGAIVIALYLLPTFWFASSWGLRCLLRH
ncbi:MAG TPA: hypothetical protein VFA68_02980 [Terriglobales bacterium]|nr:hypothetical protein [Terriglobales bacterium]